MPYPHKPWAPRAPLIPPMDHRAGWKETAFTWAMGELILLRIGDGWTMKAITADARMPAYCTVYRWMQVVPEFGAAVAQARGRLAAARLAVRDDQRLGRKRRQKRRTRGGTVSARALDGLLTRVRNGASVSEAVAAPGSPSVKALYTRVRGCPGFRAAFIDSCDWRNGWLEFQVELVVDKVLVIGIPAANARIRALQARKGRLTPKLYRAVKG